MGSEFPTCRKQNQMAVGANSLHRQETVEKRYNPTVFWVYSNTKQVLESESESTGFNILPDLLSGHRVESLMWNLGNDYFRDDY